MQTQLENLKEIPLPEPVSYAPQTVAWYVLFAVILILAGLWILHLHRRSVRNRYRREALAQLDEIEQSARPISDLPALVKRVGLAMAPRETVAGLSGDAWLAFLDSTWKDGGFSSGAGRLLPELAYGKPQSLPDISDRQVRDLFALLRRWIRRHRARI
jgi:hypothetical protein